MNSYIPAIISLISTFFSYSQPIITSENFPVNSNAEIYTVSDDDLISLSPGNSGPNQIWDYSGVSLNEIFFFSLCCEEIAPVTSYYAQFFPDANYSISIYSIEGDNHTKFYTISSNLTECIGSYFLSVNTPIYIPEITYLSNYNTFFEFPYSYNTMFNDTYQSENGNPSGTISNNYDLAALPVKGTGTGLANVARRLDLFYGNNASLRTSKENGLFSVSVFLPAEA